jgi:hypothetical protein
MSTDNPVLAEAYRLARTHNLRIHTTRNIAGDVIYWRVYRQMHDEGVYLGRRVSPSALLRFVRELARSVPVREVTPCG